ncbi:ABC transporter ATP-binding protein [Candidatus Xianfuyuplasma coldseepsis]|uniref:ABC transporter ATP-binding protein n=1 Tax=Candidatus Xianfuyuplasma coldseepsis TaxID=2782163 RepID=A0A7L7KT29_9MOLU|nr:ABC transporter ATP-binding protein [Xianfuyuplasma coldseepsis]QMS85970.1 ABC transporter ATP-binding protein [Xianfuyuplasma coldseepsis]
MIFGKSINKYYLQNLHWFILGILVIAGIDYVQTLIPLLIGDITDGLTDGNITLDGVLEIILQIGLYVVIIMVGRFLWRIFIMGSSRRFDYGLRNDLFEHAEKLSNQFYSEHKVGGLMAYFTNDIEAVRRTVGFGMVMVVDTFFLGTIVIIQLLRLNVTLTLFTALPMLIIAIVGSVFGRKIRRKFRKAQEAFERLSDFTNENLSGIRVVKAFVKEDIEIDEFLKANQNAHDRNIDYVKTQQLLDISIGAFVSLIYVVIIGYGGYLIWQTQQGLGSTVFEISDLIRFFFLFGLLIWPMMALGRIINVRNRGKGSLQRIEQILNEPIDIKDAEDVVKVEALHGDIEFRNLTFRYPHTEVDVLQDMSFTIQQGETIGILGRTGSGKTSIVDLLLRIYNVEPNTIFIDGYDIMKLPLAQVRDSIGYVPQDGFLFSDSIRNNISLDFTKATDEYDKIQQAAIMSDVHNNIIEFADGYDTVIGERGVTLSGGQRQRVSIARALIKNSPIMILDDSVSAVDTNTEVTILENLKQVRKDKTTLIIAHRISTLIYSDRIIVIDDGKIVDIGPHEVLYERCEFYRDMVERQRLEDEMEVQE